MRILVVEDNEDSRSLLLKQLRVYGHEVTATANGAEALEQALAQPPDIILSDILMPKMDGYQLCHECKQNEQLKNIPFVFYTATYTLDEDKRFALSLGADAFILKPSEPDVLAQMLSEIFEKAKSGALAPAKVVPLEPSLFLTEYNKRLVVKLDEKVAQLEAEITERKQAEDKLKDLAKFPAENPNPIVRVAKNGTILYANKGSTLVLNIWECETGKSAPEFCRQHVNDVLNSGLSKEIEIDVGASLFSFIFIPVVDEDYVNIYGRDITKHKKMEERIKHAAEEWRTTFDSITDSVSIHDTDFRLVRVNKAFANICKMKPKELIGKVCYELVHGTNEPVSNCPFRKTIRTKRPAMAEYFEPHLGIHLEVSASPIFDEKGEVVACVRVARDITQRKRMEEQLIVTDRLASIGELASGIAHELNNPLTGVIGFSELLLDRDLPDDVKEDVKVINREAKRTAQVVRNLLTFARKHPETKEPLDINSSIEKVLELRAYEQKVSNIKVNTQFDPDLPEITANGFELQQVFLNIIINAEHFMIEAHGKGDLTITTERVGDIIRASFADDGPGIAKEHLGHLFDPFFTTKKVGKGTGLGLSICHGIITEHGGRIYAESELGKGATFIVELPVGK